jgi:hypothetical protein
MFSLDMVDQYWNANAEKTFARTKQIVDRANKASSAGWEPRIPTPILKEDAKIGESIIAYVDKGK